MQQIARAIIDQEKPAHTFYAPAGRRPDDAAGVAARCSGASRRPSAPSRHCSSSARTPLLGTTEPERLEKEVRHGHELRAPSRREADALLRRAVPAGPGLRRRAVVPPGPPAPAQRLLHVSGIAEGLQRHRRASRTGRRSRRGRRSTSTADSSCWPRPRRSTCPAERFNNTQGIDLYVSYPESPEDRQSTEGSEDFTRWLERPLLSASRPATPTRARRRRCCWPSWRSTAPAGSPSTRRCGPSRRAPAGRLRRPRPALRTARSRRGGADRLAHGHGRDSGSTATSSWCSATAGADDNHLKVQLEDGYGLGVRSRHAVLRRPGKALLAGLRDGMNERMVLTTDPSGGLTVARHGRVVVRRSARALRRDARRVTRRGLVPGAVPGRVRRQPARRGASPASASATTCTSRRRSRHVRAASTCSPTRTASDYTDLWSRSVVARSLTRRVRWARPGRRR